MILFLVNYCQTDSKLVFELLNKIDKSYPINKEILLIGNGTHSTRYKYSFTRENLKESGRGGEWLKDNFIRSLSYEYEYLVQIEPDVYISDTIRVDTESEYDIMCDRIKNCCNAFVVYRRSTVEKILKSEILDSEVYKDFNYRNRKYNFKYLVCNDLILTDIVDTLKLTRRGLGEDYHIGGNGTKLRKRFINLFKVIHPNPYL